MSEIWSQLRRCLTAEPGGDTRWSGAVFGFVIGQQLPGCQHVEQAAQATGEAASQLSGHTGAVYSGTYSPDARFMVTASWDGTVLASGGFVAEVDAELCAAYGSCADYCQFGAIAVDDGQARIDYQACMCRGVCTAQCPQEAISLLRDPSRGEPLEIRNLIAEAAATAQY